jgi:GMP synthase (glutamine-hydrolysing)
VRIAFVLSEHAGGLLPARLARYRQAAARIGELAQAEVVTVHYGSIDAVPAEATVLSGSYDAWAAHDPAALERLSASLREREGPVLGICAGMQRLVVAAGGEIGPAAGPAGPAFETVDVIEGDGLLDGLGERITVWQDHSDEVRVLPAGFRVLARSPGCEVEAFAAGDRPWWGTQFHPEAWTDEARDGRAVLEGFLRLAGIPRRAR